MTRSEPEATSTGAELQVAGSPGASPGAAVHDAGQPAAFHVVTAGEGLVAAPQVRAVRASGWPSVAARRAAAALVLIAAAYICWVIARQVLMAYDPGQSLSPFVIGALAYLAVVVCIQAWAAVELWSGHRSGRLFWPVVLVFALPGAVVMALALSRNARWGGSLGSDYVQMLVLELALLLWCTVAAFEVAYRAAPSTSRLWLRVRPVWLRLQRRSRARRSRSAA